MQVLKRQSRRTAVVIDESANCHILLRVEDSVGCTFFSRCKTTLGKGPKLAKVPCTFQPPICPSSSVFEIRLSYPRGDSPPLERALERHRRDMHDFPCTFAQKIMIIFIHFFCQIRRRRQRLRLQPLLRRRQAQEEEGRQEGRPFQGLQAALQEGEGRSAAKAKAEEEAGQSGE